MGYSRFSPSDWGAYSSTVSTKTTDQIFTKREISKDLDPKNVIRESRDSDLNPNSTPVIIACDVTGSMGMIADTLVRKGIGVFFNEILDRKPISDPHLMIMGIGDFTMGDRAPLQVSQFEADITIAKWLEAIFLEHGGGGNSYESYDLPLYFAAFHTKIDSIEKRNKKGYLFTIGDEFPSPGTSKQSVSALIGDTIERDLSFDEVLQAAQEMYHVFHIVIMEGNHASRYGREEMRERWAKHYGERVILLDDHKCLSEVLVSTIQIIEGNELRDVIRSWGGDTSLVVSRAVGDLQKAENAANSGGVVRF